MSLLIGLVGIFILILLGYGLTGSIRQYAISRNIIDVPNARSSHSVPTPRGGGIAIVLIYLVWLFWGYWWGHVPFYILVGLGGAGAGIAVLGFFDDRGHVAARWRLLGHFVAAIWVLVWLGGMPNVWLFGSSFALGWVGQIIGTLYLVWLLNLYNFMDGIDGLASTEAICVCVGGVLLIFLDNSVAIDSQWWPLVALAAVVTGFLFWNFPPAKIFMGDAGSGFLGIVLATFSLQAAWTEPRWFWSWLILLGVFVVDSTFTLLRRLLRGERIYEAHRSHAYQHASRHYGRHLPVTIAVLVINFFWLIPLALCAGLGLLDGLVSLVIAYSPLLLLAVRFRAGALERTA